MSAAVLERPSIADDAIRGRGLVVGYCRISRDRIGKGLGVARQRVDIEESILTPRGWTIHEAHWFSDNDQSGWKTDDDGNPLKPRDGYDALCALIRTGRVSVLVAWHLDRLTRRPAELEALLALCQKHGVTILTVQAGAFDPNSASAVMAAQIQGVVANYESAIKRERIMSKHRELGKAGAFHGGRRRYGYTTDMSASGGCPCHEKPGEHSTGIVEDEAEIIREIARRVLDGESLSSLARELDAREIATAEGGRWTGPNLGRLIQRPHLAGRRVHQGKTVRAAWMPILSDAVHEAVVHKLSDPKRRTSHTNARRYLLAGLATCDECGLPLRGRPTYRAKVQEGEERPRAYACESGRHVHRPVVLVDEVVTSRIVARLARLTDLGVFQDDDAATRISELESALAGVEERREKTRERYTAGRLSDDEYDADLDALAERRQELSDALVEARSALAPHRVLDGVTGSQIAAERFRDLPLGRQREIVAHLLASVRLRKAPTRRAPFTPQDVVTMWRDLP